MPSYRDVPGAPGQKVAVSDPIAYFNAGGTALVGPNGLITIPPTRPNGLITVQCGNSIPGYDNYTLATRLFSSTSQFQFTNQLAGSPMRQVEITAGTRVDAYGNHSYGGQQCPAIITDITTATTGWFALLNAGGVVPDMVCIPDAIVNDINAGVSGATCISRLSQLISVIRAQWPGVIIWMDTPRTADAADQVAANEVVAWQLLQDNGTNMFVTDLFGAWGSSSAAVINENTPDGTHPTPRGAMVAARRRAVTLRRITSGYPSTGALNLNPSLTGTAAATGTGVSGTVCTGGNHTSVGTNAVVCTALLPGVRLAYTLSAEGDLGQFNIGGSTPDVSFIAGNRVGQRTRIRIISGGANIRQIQPQVRTYYSDATNDFHYGVNLESANNAVHPVYADGDVLDLSVPAFLATSGKTIINPLPYLKFGIIGGTSVVVEIDSMTIVLDRFNADGQTNATAIRALNTTYPNSQLKRRISATIKCEVTTAAGNAYVHAKVDTLATPTTIASGIVGLQVAPVSVATVQLVFDVPPNKNYRIDSTLLNGTATLGSWFESVL